MPRATPVLQASCVWVEHVPPHHAPRSSMADTHAQLVRFTSCLYACCRLKYVRVPHGSAGFYCPEGSSVETACPIATFNALQAQGDASACVTCPANSYGYMVGQASCLPCSTSSISTPGSTTCNCTAKYRFFQASDGMCICQPNYEFLDEDLNVKSDVDGDQDCFPISYARCAGGQSRDAAGRCVAPDCNDALRCPSGNGTWLPAVGMCDCVVQAPVEVRFASALVAHACSALVGHVAKPPLPLADYLQQDVSSACPTCDSGPVDWSASRHGSRQR